MHVAPLAGSTAMAFLIVGLALRHRISDPVQIRSTLQIAAIVLGLGFAFIFDDPAADSIGSAPTSLLFRRSLRFMLSALSVAAVWCVVLVSAAARVQGSIQMGVPTLYLLAGLSFVVAVACGAGQATREVPGGIAGGPLLLLMIGVSRVLPARFRFFEAEGGNGYSVSLRLAVVTVLCAAVALWTSLDPGRRTKKLGIFPRQR